MKIHIVQKGDTLWKLAQKYKVDFEALKAANSHLEDPDSIMPGMKIKIPSKAAYGHHVEPKKPSKKIPKKEEIKPIPPKKKPAPKPVKKEEHDYAHLKKIIKHVSPFVLKKLIVEEKPQIIQEIKIEVQQDVDKYYNKHVKPEVKKPVVKKPEVKKPVKPHVVQPYMPPPAPQPKHPCPPYAPHMAPHMPCHMPHHMPYHHDKWPKHGPAAAGKHHGHPTHGYEGYGPQMPYGHDEKMHAGQQPSHHQAAHDHHKHHPYGAQHGYGFAEVGHDYDPRAMGEIGAMPFYGTPHDGMGHAHPFSQHQHHPEMYGYPEVPYGPDTMNAQLSKKRPSEQNPYAQTAQQTKEDSNHSEDNNA